MAVADVFSARIHHDSPSENDFDLRMLMKEGTHLLQRARQVLFIAIEMRKDIPLSAPIPPQMHE